MTKVVPRSIELKNHPSGNRTWEMILACGRRTRRTVRGKDGKRKLPPRAVNCHCRACLSGRK